MSQLTYSQLIIIRLINSCCSGILHKPGAYDLKIIAL